MAADIILNDDSIHLEGGAVLVDGGRLTVRNREAPARGRRALASFQGSDSTRVDIHSGEIALQGVVGGRQGRVYLSPAYLHGVGRISCGRLATDQVESPAITLGGGNPEEPGSSGRLTVANDHGEVTVELNGESGTVYAGQPLQSLSDERCKENITSITGALETVSQLRGVRFRWRGMDAADTDQARHIGMIAQEVEQVVPEVVGQRDGRLTMSYAGLVPVLVDAINEQQVTIKAQAELLATLEQRLSALEAQKPC